MPVSLRPEVGPDSGTLRAGEDVLRPVRPVGTGRHLGADREQLQTDADAARDLGWRGQADSTIVRADQHAAGSGPGAKGQPRERHGHLLADTTYGSKANRRSLRAADPHIIPERDDVRRSRAKKGSRGGQAPNFKDADAIRREWWADRWPAG